MAHFQFLSRFKHLFQFFLLVGGFFLLLGCGHSVPKHTNDACAIYREFPDWLRIGKRVKARWGTPLSLQLAIIHTESGFRAKARPKRESFHLFNKSSARGYAQALNSVWRLYVQATHQLGADREDFGDASNFIGWYTHISKRRFGLSYGNTYSHYLAFHEGWGGYARSSYKHKAGVMKVARRVSRQAKRYRQQLFRCKLGQ